MAEQRALVRVCADHGVRHLLQVETQQRIRLRRAVGIEETVVIEVDAAVVEVRAQLAAFGDREDMLG